MFLDFLENLDIFRSKMDLEDSSSKSHKSPKTVNNSGINGEKLTIKPQQAKKLRKERRQQKLLQKLDKQAYQKSQQNVNAAIEESVSAIIPSKKRKKDKGQQQEVLVLPDLEKEEKEEDKPKGREYTVSIAVAASILDNAQTPQLKAYLAGQIARAAGIFNVDEVIVYDDAGGQSKAACELMARNLQYLETPPYLRKYLFQIHSDLQYSGLIAPLDIPHHLRRTEALPYREGVVSSQPTKQGQQVSYVYVGLDRDCRVEKRLREGIRVTVKFDNPESDYILKPKGKLKGCVVSPSAPRSEAGLYWGYTVRIAPSLSKVFTQSPFKDSDYGYDLTIGTSDKGYPVKNLKNKMSNSNFKHLLIVFGGVEGLEYALENDESLIEDDVSVLFDHYVNTCPDQGSRTIRTEEAVLISMTNLAPIIKSCFNSG